MTQMIQVTQVTIKPPHTLTLDFNNGDSGTIHLPATLPLIGHFAPLQALELFEKAYVDHGTVCWPGGIDLDPIVLHAWATGEMIELATVSTSRPLEGTALGRAPA